MEALTKDKIYLVEGYLKLSSLLLLQLLPYTFCILLLLCIQLLALVRSYGLPCFSKAYLSTILPSEFLFNSLYLILLFFMDLHSLLYFLPVAVHVLSGVCEFESKEKVVQRRMGSWAGKVTEGVQSVRANRP